MGVITRETMTGDNDPELFPTPTTRTYRYCDACGSFDLKEVWETTDAGADAEADGRDVPWIPALRSITLFGRVTFILLVLLGLSLGSAMILVLAPAIFIIGRWLVRYLRNRKIPPPKLLGVRCLQCDAFYPEGSRFLTDNESNPLGLTVDDLPQRVTHRFLP